MLTTRHQNTTRTRIDVAVDPTSSQPHCPGSPGRDAHRCHQFTWPDGNIPMPIYWQDHPLASRSFGCHLDAKHYWKLDILRQKVKLKINEVMPELRTVSVPRCGCLIGPQRDMALIVCHPGAAARAPGLTGRLQGVNAYDVARAPTLLSKPRHPAPGHRRGVSQSFLYTTPGCHFERLCRATERCILPF
jgi:hypothetical protein